MTISIEERRIMNRDRYRIKNNVPPERYYNGRSNPENKEYHREVKRRYYLKNKEILSLKKKAYYLKQKEAGYYERKKLAKKLKNANEVGTDRANQGNGSESEVSECHD